MTEINSLSLSPNLDSLPPYMFTLKRDFSLQSRMFFVRPILRGIRGNGPMCRRIRVHVCLNISYNRPFPPEQTGPPHQSLVYGPSIFSWVLQLEVECTSWDVKMAMYLSVAIWLCVLGWYWWVELRWQVLEASSWFLYYLWRAGFWKASPRPSRGSTESSPLHACNWPGQVPSLPYLGRTIIGEDHYWWM